MPLGVEVTEPVPPFATVRMKVEGGAGSNLAVTPMLTFPAKVNVQGAFIVVPEQASPHSEKNDPALG
jgi:hypothetical protein